MAGILFIASPLASAASLFSLASRGVTHVLVIVNRKKFKVPNFKKLLLSIQDKSMEHQKQTVDDTIENWRGENEQIDDICLIGMRV